MTGCVALRKDVYYIRLSYYDRGHVRRDKWVSTGLSGRGAQKKATAMIDSMIEKYSYLEKSDHPSKMSDYLKMWKELQMNEVAETTYDGYHTYIDRHMIPYLGISISTFKTSPQVTYSITSTTCPVTMAERTTRSAGNRLPQYAKLSVFFARFLTMLLCMVTSR